MTRIFLPVVATLLFILSSSLLAKEYCCTLKGVVVKVTDGDTLTINANGAKVKVRLYGIDAPESEKVNRRTGKVYKAGQPYGEEAFHALSDKVSGKLVHLDVMDTDRYRRVVGIVWVDGREVNREMVAEGWAWAYKQYLDRPHASEYLRAEEEARRAQHGLWVQRNPQPPWEFRQSLRIRGN